MRICLSASTYHFIQKPTAGEYERYVEDHINHGRPVHPFIADAIVAAGQSEVAIRRGN